MKFSTASFSIWGVCFLFGGLFASAQKKIAIIGSSTSACFGPSFDSCYVTRLQKYYSSLGTPVTITNLALGGANVYKGMPSSYTPPSNRSAETPDVNRNITAAIASNPDVILVNYPSNNYDIYSVSEVMFCFRTIMQAANNAGKSCYITTTQPRSAPASFSTSETRRKMAEIKEQVLLEFGSYAVNFWDGIANPADSTAFAIYSAGDGIHLGNAGHRILFNRVVEKNILNIQQNPITGLKYRYYEGTWTVLPNFNLLAPMKTGSSSNIDINMRTPGRNDKYAFVWEGNMNIPTAGTYTFEIVSDDGSKLYFNSLYSPSAIATISNDGLHAATSKKGTVNIPAAGAYPVAITFFENTGGETMQFYWSGPGIQRQLVPDHIFVEGTPALPDVTSPSVPANLKVVSSTNTSINLDWDDATDNVAVAGYDIFTGGNKYSSLTSHFTLAGLAANTSHTFTVSARDLAGNTSAASTPVTGTTTNTTTTTGLNYRYYEGTWDVLPNFNTLTPVKTGTSPNIDISLRRAGRNDNYAFIWEGNIHITTPGTYTFETVSDDGSKLYFNSVYSATATATVSNDGLHAAISKKTTTTIAAGTYPVAITFFENNGGELMQVYWTGPGIGRQLIPDHAFSAGPLPAPDLEPPSVPTNLKVVSAANTTINLDWDDATDNVGVASYNIYYEGSKKYSSASSNISATGLAANTSYTFTVKAVDLSGNESILFSNAVTGTTTNTTTRAGLSYRYYEGTWTMLPNFNTLVPVSSGTSANVDINVRRPGKNDGYAFVWEGYITIPAAGSYTFETISDDGSKLYFNSLYSPSAVATVTNDNIHPAISKTKTVSIAAAGSYPIAITFFENNGGETMQVYWSSATIPRQLIPDAAFTQLAASSVMSTLQHTTRAREEMLLFEQPEIAGAYPNPFSESFTIEVNSKTASNRVDVGIYELSGRLVCNYYFNNLSAGVNTLLIKLSGNLPLNQGLYFVKLNVNGVSSRLFKLVKVRK